MRKLLFFVLFLVLPISSLFGVGGDMGGGAGTAGSPYLIEDFNDFQEFCGDVGYWDDHVRLDCDLDLDPNLEGRIVYSRAPIAGDTYFYYDFNGTVYSGSFDGNGHVISNLVVDGEFGYCGLFGKVDNGGEIKNLGVVNASVKGVNDFVGGLVGNNYYGNIVGCYYSGEVIGTKYYVGGLIGYNDHGDIENCYANGEIISSRNYVGGLIGYSDSGDIINCYSVGDVNSLGFYVGGLVGENENGDIEGCYSSGDIIGLSHVGGLLGFNRGGNIISCYSVGGATGSSYFIGGLIGYNWGGKITDCYTSGNVTGSDSGVGGFAGWSSDSIITSCYFYLYGGPDNGLGVGLDEAELLDKSSFDGFDFAGDVSDGNDDDWVIEAGYMPRLSWQGGTGFEAPDGFPGITTILEGSGSREDPFIIADYDDMMEFRNNSNLRIGFYSLVNDIDLTDVIYTKDFGEEIVYTEAFITEAFGGSFSGNGHTIKNLRIESGLVIDAGHNLGFFNILNGCVSNLSVTDVSITSLDPFSCYYVGGLAGKNYGLVADCYSSCDVNSLGSRVGGLVGGNNGYVTDCSSTGSVEGKYRVGGLVGTNNGDITSCYSISNVNGGHSVGGLAGDNRGDIISSYSASSLAGNNGVGGFVGNNYGDIIDCYSISDVNGDSSVGGLVGQNGGDMTGCYSIGDVNGNSYVGGLTGDNSGDITGCYSISDVNGESFVGGLTGYNLKDISNCYSTGFVSGSGEDVGGLAGYNEGYLIGCYSAGDVTGLGECIGGLVGENDYHICSCYSSGVVTGVKNVGGLIGMNDGWAIGSYSIGDVTGDRNVGGLTGINYRYITGCYSARHVTGLYNIGGFLGVNSGGNVADSFWDVDTCGQSAGYNLDPYRPGWMTNVFGKTTVEMQTLSTFTDAGWDFVDSDGDAADWFMPWSDYPQLFWEEKISCVGEVGVSLAMGECGRVSLDVYSRIDEVLGWAISGYESCGWIVGVDPNSGSSSGPNDVTVVNIDVDSVGLGVGDYQCELVLEADNGDSVDVPILMHVYNRVDLEELAVLGQYWQMNDCNEGQECSAADWYVDGVIDILDLGQLAMSWLGEEVIKWHRWEEYLEDFNAGLPIEGWSYNSTSYGRIRVIDGQLVMDRADDNGYSLNEAILHVNLAGQSEIELSFRQRSGGGEEAHSLPAMFSDSYNGDGVAVSNDGINWTTVVDASELRIGTDWKTFTVDLDSVGVEYGCDFQIKFQQYDQYSWNDYGILWDDVRVYKVE